MNEVYLISASTLKSNTPINLNVDNELLKMSILDAQNIHIQSLLGGELYRKILTLISNDTIGDAGNSVYKTLLDDYLIPSTTHWAMYECTPYIRYKFMNKNVGGEDSDNSTGTSLDELKYLQNELKQKAEFYGERVVDFVRDNSNDLPEYHDNDGFDVLPVDDAFDTGLFLDESYGKGKPCSKK